MRTKRTIINFLTDVVPQVLIAIIGIWKSKVFLDCLGEQQLGLYQLYAQIVAYLILIEGGVGSATLFRLYKPLNKNDKNEVNTIMSTSKQIFNIIMLIMFVLSIVLTFVISFIVDSSTINLSYIRITFFIFVLSQIIFYITIPQRTIFDADQKRYVPNMVFQITTIIKSILELIIVLSGGELLHVVISLLIINVLACTIIYLLSKKYYPYVNYKGKKDYSILKDVKHLFVNTIGNLVANNIDIIIITKYIGLGSVVIYSSYNYVIESLKQIIEKITGATMSSVASLLIEDKEKSSFVFNEFNSLCFYLASIICIPLYFSINQFISLLYEGKIITSNLLAILFTIILFYQIIKIPLKVYMYASGMFEKVKKYVILECIVNLVLSIILVKYFKMSGVLIATIISFFTCDYFPKSKVILRTLFDRTTTKYHFNNLKLILINIITVIIFSLFKFDYSNLFMWFIGSLGIFIINLILVTLYFYFNKELEFIDRIKHLLRSKKNENI